MSERLIAQGKWRDALGEFTTAIYFDDSKTDDLINRAARNRRGRATAANGALIAVAKRLPKENKTP